MRVIAVLFVVFSISSCIVVAQTGQTRPRQAQINQSNDTQQSNSTQIQKSETVINETDVLKVDTALVTIPVSVLETNGRFVSNLQQQDFKIFENGKEQEVGYFGTTEQPVTIALVLDTSPSTEFRIEQIQNAAIAFVNQLKPNDRVMVVEFDANVNVLCELTNDRLRLQKAIRKADFGDGTSLFDTVEKVLGRYLSQIEGRKAVVLFTDGVDTTSNKATDLSSLQLAEKSEAPIYTVYYDTLPDYLKTRNAALDEDPSLGYGMTREEYELGRQYLLNLTKVTGGRIYSTDATRNLDVAFSGIAEELRRQYVIGFYPKEAGQAGQRKQIQVRVNLPGVTVRARESYVIGN